MSGTSIDGIDLCVTDFWYDECWQYQIVEAETLSYSALWRDKLPFRNDISASELLQLDHQYGLHLGKTIREFLDQRSLKVDMIASHGHTYFHQPEKGFTWQLGCGPEIFAHTGIPTVTDFRKQDVMLGGQGAPLVPIGDLHLFPAFAGCLNLGGFANISIKRNDDIIAYDLTPFNMALNYLARQRGLEYDADGALARQGAVDNSLLDQLNRIEFYRKEPPKSLGVEWFNTYFLTLLQNKLTIEDNLATVTAHAREQIQNAITQQGIESLLITGGGAYNSFFIDQLRENTDCTITVPDPALIDFKEALIFAFMGLLRSQNQINILSAVTGATHDHSSGVLYS